MSLGLAYWRDLGVHNFMTWIIQQPISYVQQTVPIRIVPHQLTVVAQEQHPQ